MEKLSDELAAVLRQAAREPRNMGELADADAVGTVGNASCGEMMRMWVKFKEENGRKVIDRATFQSFGCETAIAVASLATELIRGKTPTEALALKSQDLSGEIGPLPPMKIHCAELVEGALHAALDPGSSSASTEQPSLHSEGNLLDNFMSPPKPAGGLRIVLLDSPSEEKPAGTS